MTVAARWTLLASDAGSAARVAALAPGTMSSVPTVRTSGEALRALLATRSGRLTP